MGKNIEFRDEIEKRESPYTEEWLDHKFCVFLKMGICQKTHDIDYLLNVKAVDDLCQEQNEQLASMLRVLANRFEKKANSQNK